MRYLRALLLIAPFTLGAQELVLYGERLAVPRGAAPKQLLEQVLPVFTREYSKRMKLEATSAEIETMKNSSPELRRQQGSSAIADTFLRSLITNFKVNRALFRKHGGRVALSAFGFHVATDATVAELRALEKKGEFQISQPGDRASLYAYLEKLPGDGTVAGKAAEDAFRDAPWEKQPLAQ